MFRMSQHTFLKVAVIFFERNYSFTMFITALCVIFFMKLRWPKNRSLYDTICVLLQLLSLLHTLENDMQILQDNVHKLLETVEDFSDT